MGAQEGRLGGQLGRLPRGIGLIRLASAAQLSDPTIVIVAIDSDPLDLALPSLGQRSLVLRASRKGGK